MAVPSSSCASCGCRPIMLSIGFASNTAFDRVVIAMMNSRATRAAHRDAESASKTMAAGMA